MAVHFPLLVPFTAVLYHFAAGNKPGETLQNMTLEGGKSTAVVSKNYNIKLNMRFGPSHPRKWCEQQLKIEQYAASPGIEESCTKLGESLELPISILF